MTLRSILLLPKRLILRIYLKTSRVILVIRRKKAADYYVISHPKAGRTWLAVLLARIISIYFDVPMSLDIIDMKLEHNPKIPGILFTHAGSEIDKRLKRKDFQFKIPLYVKGKKIIFLARDPRDTIVSFYYQATKRRRVYDGSISEFIRDDRLGIYRLIEFMNLWARYVRDNPNAIMVLYEDLHHDAKATLKRILAFIGLNDVGEDVLDDAVKFASFENMRRMEREGYFQDARLLPADLNDPNSYKVRKGKVGGYLEELSPEDIKYVEMAMKYLDSMFPYKSSKAPDSPLH